MDEDEDEDERDGTAATARARVPLRGRVKSAKQLAGSVAVHFDRSIAGRLYNRLLEIEFIDRAVALAANAGGRLVATENPGRNDEGPVRAAFAPAENVKAATGLLGLIFLFFYATTFTSALQRLYLRCWRRPPGGGVRNQGRGAAWLAGLLMLVAINVLLSRVLVGAPGDALRVVFPPTALVFLWWWTSHTMLRGEIGWRPLLPGAILAGVGLPLYGWSASSWMASTVASNDLQFGYFGLSLSLVTWFVGLSFLIVIAAALGPTLSEGPGRFARWLRGPQDSVLKPGARPALPAPDRSLRFADALGLDPRTDADS